MLRWRVAILVSAAIAISYLDRQTLPVAIGAIRADIPISNQVKAFLDSAFLVTYGLMAAQVSARCPGVRHQGRRLGRLDTFCGGGCGMSAGRRHVELAESSRAFGEPGAENPDLPRRGRHAVR